MGMYENGNGLDEEIKRLTAQLTKLDPATDVYKVVRTNLDSLYKLRIDQYKIELENNEKQTKLEKELEFKEKELTFKKCELALNEKEHEFAVSDSKKNRTKDYVISGIGTAVKVAGLVILAGTFMSVANQGYEFEKTGVPTSPTFRETKKNIVDLIKWIF